MVNHAAKIMIQGTMSNVGKSIITAGLCRIFTQDGFSVAPFKSQNMALNSYITRDGGEMGRAQVVQAEACGIEPSVSMNPVLLKPISDQGSQVIVNGQARTVMSAREYFATRIKLLPEIMEAYNSLASVHDIIVIEGAGSPAEINLRRDDIVNMGLATRLDSPVLLVGDIDRGGVFAQLVGTCALLPDDERELIQGLIINKFRGDVSLLSDGLLELEGLTGKPVLGVVPYLDMDIDDEDSLAERLTKHTASPGCDIAIIRLPRVSNFSDFTALGATSEVSVRYVDSPQELGSPDVLIIPGTRTTIPDLAWLRDRSLDRAIITHAQAGGTVLGICGGYQMLGDLISDPDSVESGGCVPGLGLLPVTTVFRTAKQQTRVSGTILQTQGPLEPMSGTEVIGYEIHMGESTLDQGAQPWIQLDNGTFDGCWQSTVYGTYLHGLFDTTSSRTALLRALNLECSAPMDYSAYKNGEYNKLAESLRDSLDMDRIYDIMGRSR